MLTAQHGGYFCWLVWALSAVLRLCFSRKVSLKSDTAVALRRGVSKVPCITLNIYNEYFCEFMWLSAITLHVLELLNITRKCKLRVLDINMNFTE